MGRHIAKTGDVKFISINIDAKITVHLASNAFFI